MLENLTVVIPFRNGHATIERLLDSLPVDLPVLVVDDMSDQPYTNPQARANVSIIRPVNRGYFAGSVNTGLRATTTDALVLNQDVELKGNKWQTLIRSWQSDGFGIAGDAVTGHPAFPKSYVQGTFMFLSRAAITALGPVPLNQEFYPLWGCTAAAQLQLCRLGYKAAPVPMSEYGMVHARGNAPYGSSILQTLLEQPDQQSLFVRTPPAISVVITCHNYGRFLTDAVNSLVGGKTSLGIFRPQTFASFEVVIVDDASTDETAEIAESLTDAWKGIRYLRLEKNVGSAQAMNAGVRASFGKWIAPLDADDMYETDRLEHLYRAGTLHPHSVIYDDITGFADTPEQLAIMGLEVERKPQTLTRASMYQVSYAMPEYDFDRLLTKNGMHKGIFFPRAAFDEVGGYPENFTDGREDWAMNVLLGSHGYCGEHVRKPLYLHRRHPQNRTNTNGHRNYRQYFIDRMEARFPRLYAGERPPMCCGRRTNTNGNGNGSHGNGNQQSRGMTAAVQQMGGLRRGVTAMSNVGAEGMTKVRYQAGGSGSVPYTGSFTHKQYVFGGDRILGYVDNRDLKDFLKIQIGGRPTFVVVQDSNDTEYVTTLTADAVNTDRTQAFETLTAGAPGPTMRGTFGDIPTMAPATQTGTGANTPAPWEMTGGNMPIGADPHKFDASAPVVGSPLAEVPTPAHTPAKTAKAIKTAKPKTSKAVSKKTAKQTN